MSITFEATRQGYLNLWDRMQVRPEKVAAADAIARRILEHRADYEAIEQKTGIPWFLIGCIHYRESDLDFDTYLGNGQSLHRVTTEVPRGRGPFKDFVAGAIDALALDGLDQVKEWPIERIAYSAERENGLGYFGQRINSPYVWSWSDLYVKGKYVSDGSYDAEFVDPQCGVMVLVKRLAVADASVAARIALPVLQAPPAQPDNAIANIIVAALRAAADTIEKAAKK